jgi:hypothetical protein
MNANNSEIKSSYPLKSLVWPGAILASVAHSIFLTRAPLMAHAQSWDSRNYNIQNSEGSRGTIAFGEDSNVFVAVFYFEFSKRNPLNSHTVNKKLINDLLPRVPNQLKPLLDEALQYVLQDCGGDVCPVITASFWSDPESIYISSNEPWSEVIKNGAVLVQNQICDLDSGMEAWMSEFELSASETALVKEITKKRIQAPNGPLKLNSAWTTQIFADAEDSEGVEACRVALAEIEVILANEDANTEQKTEGL